MPLLARDAILSAADLPHRDLEVLEWGGTVRVRALTASERDAFEQGLLDASRVAKGRPQVRARLLALCLVDEAGSPLFAEADIEALGKKSAKAVDRLFGIARRLSGMAAGDIEELEKN